MYGTTASEVGVIAPGAMQKTKFGALFQKDTWDLFASLILSLKLSTRKQMAFKAYHNVFLGSEAIRKLTSLKFIRSPDTRDLSNLVPLSTHTVKLPEDSALTLMQHFLDGSLFCIATTKKEALYFKKKDLYALTHKGMRIIEEFLQICELETEGDHLIAALSSRDPSRPTLVRLERRLVDDELIISQAAIFHLFRLLAGPFPNYGSKNHPGVLLIPEDDKYKLLKDLFKKKSRPLGGKISSIEKTHCVAAPRIIHWLCDNSVISSPQEAAEVAAHFVRFGLLVLVADGMKKDDTIATFTVNGPILKGNASVTPTAEFRYSHRGIYALTDEGSFIAGWLAGHDPTMRFIAELLAATPSTHKDSVESPKEEQQDDLANAERLRSIIQDTTVLTLFRHFLREKHGENDLAFWIEVQDFKTKLAQIAKVTARPASPPVAGSSRTPMELSPPSERPYESLGNVPFMIYNKYMSPSSECRLSVSIDSGLQEELQASLENCIECLTKRASETDAGDIGSGNSTSLDVDQLEILVWLYDRIQARVFDKLANRLVPKFLKWPKYLQTEMNRALTSITEEETS